MRLACDGSRANDGRILSFANVFPQFNSCKITLFKALIVVCVLQPQRLFNELESIKCSTADPVTASPFAPTCSDFAQICIAP